MMNLLIVMKKEISRPSKWDHSWRLVVVVVVVVVPCLVFCIIAGVLM